MSSVIVNPIARPAIDLNVPPGSAAVAKTTQTRKKVSTISITSPCHCVTPRPRAGVPRFARFRIAVGKSQRRSSEAMAAAANCVTQ